MNKVKLGELNGIVIKRDGSTVAFDSKRIYKVICNAWEEVNETVDTIAVNAVTNIANDVLNTLQYSNDTDTYTDTYTVEGIQNAVESSLMRSGETVVARNFILYRDKHTKMREGNLDADTYTIMREGGGKYSVSFNELVKPFDALALGLDCVDLDAVRVEFKRTIYTGMAYVDLNKAMLMSVTTLMDTDPEYDVLATRILALGHYTDVAGYLGKTPSADIDNSLRYVRDSDDVYRNTVISGIKMGVSAGLIDGDVVKKFDIEYLVRHCKPCRDDNFTYIGLQTLIDRYFIHKDGMRIELPQGFFIRVAMGLASNEVNPTEKCIEFYDVLSRFEFMSSTPTLFNSCTKYPQMSSCYISTTPDDLMGIYDVVKEDAALSKRAGGLGNDFTPVRALGAHIKGTNGKSQGIIPFIKVVNDTAVAVNQGGVRKGACAIYLETWHLDIEDFLDLRKNTGDERRRAHDIHPVNWIPDLFMRRAELGEVWTLFSPDDVPELHELYGEAFAKRYTEYESSVDITHKRVVDANTLYRKMTSRLFETGHPWKTWKDAANVRSPQQHVGVVHSSNLCTEIFLNTSYTETAVCNLGSINLIACLNSDKSAIDVPKLKRTIKTAVRMLDNVIDLNLYPVENAERSNMRHRPIGLGIMGFQDVLYHMGISYDSEDAVTLAGYIQEVISWHAINTSSDLAVERGSYDTFWGSDWSKGIVPVDTINRLNASRPYNDPIEPNLTLDWDFIRNKVRTSGMRNSCVMAIAPTATIGNICGVTASIEPTYLNIHVKSNLSGEFTMVNKYLVDSLKSVDMWSSDMLYRLKMSEGSIQDFLDVPKRIRETFKTAFEVDQHNLVRAAAARQHWIDQGESLNLYVETPTGPGLQELYYNAWRLGLKSTYYLRSMAATSTSDEVGQVDNVHKVCSIDDSDCEACQ